MKAIFLRLFFTLIFLLILLYPEHVSADENFDVAYSIFYRFQDTDNAQVTQTTTLTNKQTNIYAQEFEVSILGKLVGEVSGFDGEGSLKLTSDKIAANKTRIRAVFNQKSVGLNSKLTFSINYTLSGLVNRIGRVKEITIPKPSDSSFTSYEVKISLPKEYGPVAFVKPGKKFEQTETSYIFSFNSQEASKGILIGIGDVANFQFKLTYHLKNNSLIQRKTEIALPADTLYQEVLYSLLSPLPLDVYIDKDGNWIATYDLYPQQSLEVVALGNALIYANPRDNFYEAKPGQELLLANKYWETTSEEVEAIAKKYDTPEKIYDFVSKTLKYNYSRVNSGTQRLGAKTALKKTDEAICMEFTDTFIALARASGIPAREVNGYAYTSDSLLKPLSLVADVLHAWPEYWDKETSRWVPIDPTWGNTTGGLDYFRSFDLNHFAFVRHGVSSTYPLAAGSYKTENVTKDVEIIIKDDLPAIPNSSVEFSLEIPKKILAGGEQNILLTVYNKGGVARYDLPIEIEAQGFTVKLNQNKITIPPYGKGEVVGKLKGDKRKFWGKVPIMIAVAGEKKTIDVEVEPLELLYFPFLIWGLIGLLTVTIMLLYRKNVYKKRT